jgi:retinol-binding protein 3
MLNHFRTCAAAFGALIAFASVRVDGQQMQSDAPVDAAARGAVIETLATRIESGYVVPEVGQLAARELRKAAVGGSYDTYATARAFAEKVTLDLRSVSKDRHLALYFDPAPKPAPGAPAPQLLTRERFNYGFNKLESLPGNVGYLEIGSFANLDERSKETASTFLSALSNFDSIILDLRRNGGGNTPMAAYVASYFLGPKPVRLSTIYWRDENRTIDVMTSEVVTGRRSLDRDLFLLVGPSTFSAAEDFSYSLQQLKRATLVGETTGGGAHMGKGLQRLSPLFTAFIPIGQSINPITNSNWEGMGVAPDVKVPADKALQEAHRLAIIKLLNREQEPGWRDYLQRESTAGK